MESQDITQPVTYTIAGTVYRLEPLSWQQNKWLGEYIFKDLDMQALDYAVVHDLLRDKGPLFMAICLLPAGQSRVEQARQPFSAIQALAQTFAGELTGGEVARFGPHFFRFNRPDQLAMLVPGRALLAQLAALVSIEPSLADGASGSSAVSSLSATATSPDSIASSASGDRLTPSPISSDVPNGEPLIPASSAG